MLSKNQLKFISSLKHKKYRDQHKLFIVEGTKAIDEFFNSPFKLHSLYSTEEYLDKDFIQISEIELAKISQLNSPNKALAIFEYSKADIPLEQALILALDSLRDPGNLGTIIRMCDWFGIKSIVCSLDTVDCYNPKVVQATMGSLSRVHIHYTNLEEYLDRLNLPIYGAFLDGINIYKCDLPTIAVLLMGNEANGISKEIENLIDQKITIPRLNNSKVESLNVATATAICLSEFKRGLIEK